LHRVVIPEASLPARLDVAGSVDQETAGEKVILAAGTGAEFIEKFVQTQLAHALDWKVRFLVFLTGEVGFEAELVVRVLTHDEPFGGCKKFLRHCAVISVDGGSW
jgi:hypothetical protein